MRAAGWRGAALAWALLALAPALPGGLAPGPVTLDAQAGRDLRSREARVLREAGGREAAGDPAGAEAILRSFLEEEPGSTGALFALERVLRNQGRLVDLLPVVDRAVATGAGGAPVRYLKLRLLVETDSLEAVGPEIEDWIRDEPGSVEPYREGARALERAEGPEAAVALLQRGLDRIGGSSALELDIGDVLVRAGDGAGAAVHWARGLGDDAVQLPTLLRRVQGLSGAERNAVVAPLIEALGAEPTTPARLRAGITLAMESRMAPEARALAERTEQRLSGAARNTFLGQLARDAGAAGDAPLQLWAMQAHRETASPPDVRALDGEIARVALSLGDTATALRARSREADAWPRGSSERRRALSAAMALEVATRPPREVQERLEAFRTEFPGAAEVDEVASLLARNLVSQGDSAAAQQVLRQMDGPAAARERALLALGGPDPREARGDLLAAASGLPPVQATELLQLVSLLDGLSGDGGRLAAGATVQAQEGDPEEGAARILQGVDDLPPADRPALLAMAARMLDAAGDRPGAADVREHLVSEYPEASEVGEAVLSLARWRASSPDGVPGAILLLEEFIVDRPSSPAVPEARRELNRLQRRTGTGGPS